jgi:hypothetical protein
MRIAWFFGFGWLSTLVVVACGVAISRLSSPLAWALYVPFLLVALYMTVRFRLFNAQPWRRVHSRSMLAYAKLAGHEYNAAKAAGREFDIKVPCRGLAAQLFGTGQPDAIDALLGDGRRAYYLGLVQACPQIFLQGVGADRHDLVLGGVRRDIDASQLGPDIVIALAIERKLGRPEAARYLQALLLGRVR